MQIGATQGAYNSLDFTINTTSGDKISLNMYDKKSFSYQEYQENGLNTKELTLSHVYGYKFSYEGNGIDANDRREIEEALKAIQPKVDDYLRNVKESGIPSPKEILNDAFSMRQNLPQLKDENYKNAVADGLLKTFDKSLSMLKADQIVLESAKTIFEKILEQFESFSLYA
ncbi:MAG: ATP/GTP-binding protein [Campylobacteraceae bacterium]|nr:ATP/GTP-binding protein [Campylobacteraceae bacterium]